MAGTKAALTRLRELFRPTLDFLGYELYDLKLTGSGGHPTLLVAIDRPQGVSLDDCEKVSKSLSALLDQADPLPTRYDLEVSSPAESAPAVADRRAVTPPDAIRGQVDPGTAEIAIFGRRRVVEQVSDPGTEVSLDEAKAARPGVEPGQVVEVPLPTDDFARLAA